MLKGGDVGDDSKQKEKQQKIRKERESMEKLFGLTEEKRIRDDKMSPKCKQFLKKCEPGLQAWKNLFSEFSKHIPPGEEEAKGK